jgi:hypothetical protein
MLATTQDLFCGSVVALVTSAADGGNIVLCEYFTTDPLSHTPCVLFILSLPTDWPPPPEQAHHEDLRSRAASCADPAATNNFYLIA